MAAIVPHAFTTAASPTAGFVALAAGFFSVAPGAWAKAVPPAASTRLPITAVAAIIFILCFSLSSMVKGFSVVDVGVSQRVARGEVYNLKSAEDFEGTFAADSGHPGGRLPQPVVAGGRSTVWPVAMVTPSGSTLDRRPGDVAGTS